MTGEWDEDETTRPYRPRGSRASRRRVTVDVETAFFFEQRIAALERRSVRMLEYLRRALRDPRR